MGGNTMPEWNALTRVLPIDDVLFEWYECLLNRFEIFEMVTFVYSRPHTISTPLLPYPQIDYSQFDSLHNSTMKADVDAF